MDFAATLASVGLRRKDIAEDGTRSWTEVPFGQPAGFVAGRELPWDATAPVTVPNTPIRLRGTIDRLDLRSAPSAVRVTDYKTSEPPKNAARIVIGGGTELQRALYGLACRQLLEGEPQIIARLLYLVGEPQALRLNDLDAAVEQIACLHQRGGRDAPKWIDGAGPSFLRAIERSAPGAAGLARLRAAQARRLRQSRQGRLSLLERAMTTSDSPARLRALTELDTTMLVEAAAGTGKTSLLAGRVIMLLAAGINPASIAAITFTELAAGELRQRVARYLDLLAGRDRSRRTSAVPAPRTGGGAEDGPARGRRTARRTDLLDNSWVLPRPPKDVFSGSRDRSRCGDPRWRASGFCLRCDVRSMVARPARQADCPATIPWHRSRAGIRRAQKSSCAGSPNSVDVTGRLGLPLPTSIPKPTWISRKASANSGAGAIASARLPMPIRTSSLSRALASHFEGRFDPLPSFEQLWDLAHPGYAAHHAQGLLGPA